MYKKINNLRIPWIEYSHILQEHFAKYKKRKNNNNQKSSKTPKIDLFL